MIQLGKYEMQTIYHFTKILSGIELMDVNMLINMAALN